jgi:hypothetical protein
MKRASFLAVFAIVLANGANAACSGAIDIASTVLSGKQYDPFSARVVSDQYMIRILNHGGEACDFALAFSASSDRRQLGGIIPYSISDVNRRPLVISALHSIMPQTSLTASHVNTVADLPFFISIDRGIFAHPNRYSDDLTVTLYTIESGHLRECDNTTLSITYIVPQVLDVSIGKSNANWTVNFGELMQGAQSSILLRTRSNVPYYLRVSSYFHGNLSLDPPLSNKAWSIPYTATIDERVIDISKSGYNAYISELTGNIGGDQHLINITIGDTYNKIAGIYKDIIAVEIVAARL